MIMPLFQPTIQRIFRPVNEWHSSIEEQSSNLHSPTAWIAIFLLGISSASAADQVEYLGRLGLFSGSEFTHTSGSQTSDVNDLTESGYLCGFSFRYNGSNDAGRAAWVANAATGQTTRIGLIGAVHTRGDGYQHSHAELMTESGHILGKSSRYNGANSAGSATWVANAATGQTTRIGLADVVHTRADGFQESYADSLTESGYIKGRSTSYNAADVAGQSAWVANAATGTTTRVGLFAGSEFTTSNNTQYSGADYLTESGLVGGFSRRYNYTGSSQSQAAWVFDASTGYTTRVGFFSGEEFTNSFGDQITYMNALANSGYAGGSSTRYHRVGFGGITRYRAGRAAWVFDLATGVTTRVGFDGSGYSRPITTSAGVYEENSSVELVAESGHAFGHSERYNHDGSRAGYAAWVASAAMGQTTRIGLYSGPEFTSPSDQQDSAVYSLVGSGHALGVSGRYNVDGFEAGNAIWVANATTGETTRVGLFSGSEFTGSDSYQYSGTSYATESGYVLGYSNRYNGGGSDAGRAAWAANATTGQTTRIGLTDAIHTRADGYQYSQADSITESGYVSGYSTRYGGGGKTAWVYHAASDLRTDLALSVSSSGYSWTTIEGITDNGVAYGYYQLFAGATSLGNRAFVWSAEVGAIALDERVSGGVAQHGWQYFFKSSYGNGGGYVAGSGTLTNGNSGLFLVRVNSEVEPPANFYEWVAAFHPEITGGPEGDHDHDGIPNLTEYAFALDPKSPTPSSALPQPQSLPSEYRIQFTRPTQALGLTYVVEWSDDLSDWQILTDHGSGEEHDFRLAKTPSLTRVFFRHRNTTSPP